MELQELRVIHGRKGGRVELRRLPDAIPGDAFHLDSCQRQLWVTDHDPISSVEMLEQGGYVVFEGSDAYRFLLKVATGLESQILGETDIFGQFKDAWSRAELSPRLRASLGPWIQRLFEDTKEIRSRHLQNLGSASYGSLVRKFIQERLSGPILLVGAGQLARSVAPYLVPADGEGELWICNRNRENLLSFQRDLKPRFRGRIRILNTPEEEAQAWREAACAVVCIPFDTKEDARRRALWMQGAPERKLVHLGGLREQGGLWNSLPAFHPLDDLFELQKSQGQVRSLQVGQALKACDERSKLRALGTSVSLPHGWEDLAVFA